MRRVMLALGLIGALVAPVVADISTPSEAGTMVVDGRVLPGHFYKVGDQLWFPILDLARAEGRDVTWDPGSATLRVRGAVQSVPVQVLHDEPCVRWLDLRDLLPGVQMGMSGTQAVFSKASPQKPAAKTGEKIKVVNGDNPGQPIDIKEFVVPGKYTVLDMYSEYCGPCRNWGEALKALVARRDDLVVRQFNVNRAEATDGIDFDSPLCEQYHLDSVPHFVLYDPSGKNLGDDFSFTTNELIKWMREAGMTEADIKKFDLY